MAKSNKRFAPKCMQQLLEELVRLHRENTRLRMEREILAKATAWFAQQTARVT